MFYLLRNLIFLLPIGALFITNPTMDDFIDHAREIVSDKQSMARSAWSSVSSSLGLDYVTGAVGAGTYEICRFDLYLLSLYRVQSSKSLGEDSPVAVGVGGANALRIWPVAEGENPLINIIVNQLSGVSLNECKVAKKKGDLSLS